jgi:ParB family chromosome partitioning protein
MTRKALGRGLGALIPGAPEPGSDTALHAGTGESALDDALAGAAERADAVPSGDRVAEIPLDRIHPNPRQPRTEFDEAALLELAESIRAHGVLQPVLVRTLGDGYELIAGERRYRASRLIGLASIPAIVRVASDDEVLEIALIENLQREDLNPIEEALGYQRLIDELRYTHERLSERVGRNRSSITNSLRLLTLPGGVQAMVSRGTLSSGHARALLGLQSSAEIEASARYVVDMALSVRKTEALVARKLRRKTAARRPRGGADGSQVTVDSVSNVYAEWTDALRRRFATAIRIVPEAQGERGRIEIEYYNETDLERVLELLGVL